MNFHVNFFWGTIPWRNCSYRFEILVFNYVNCCSDQSPIPKHIAKCNFISLSDIGTTRLALYVWIPYLYMYRWTSYDILHFGDLTIPHVWLSLRPRFDLLIKIYGINSLRFVVRAWAFFPSTIYSFILSNPIPCLIETRVHVEIPWGAIPCLIRWE